MNMLRSTKQLIKRALNTMGFELHCFHPEVSPLARLITSLNHFSIDLVFDIGANEGQFAKELRTGGYSGRIISFEPLSAAYQILSNESAKDSKWQLHPRCAIGDRAETTQINIAGNSVSSSILPMLSTHCNAAPDSEYTGREQIPVIPLDSAANLYLETAQAAFAKIDTQGYEWRVLDGARDILPKLRGVQMELSMIELYEGQHLWLDCIERLETEGFVLWALQPEFTDPKTGRVLQMNGLFFRQ